MEESFLHFVWRFQYFDKKNLKTTINQPLEIIKQGSYNTDAGPDFSFSKILVNGVEWAGNIEIHVKSSDWFLHNHQKDASYNNVVLHVVFDHDVEVETEDGNILPVLELKGRLEMQLY